MAETEEGQPAQGLDPSDVEQIKKLLLQDNCTSSVAAAGTVDGFSMDAPAFARENNNISAGAPCVMIKVVKHKPRNAKTVVANALDSYDMAVTEHFSWMGSDGCMYVNLTPNSMDAHSMVKIWTVPQDLPIKALRDCITRYSPTGDLDMDWSVVSDVLRDGLLEHETPVLKYLLTDMMNINAFETLFTTDAEPENRPHYAVAHDEPHAEAKLRCLRVLAEANLAVCKISMAAYSDWVLTREALAQICLSRKLILVGHPLHHRPTVPLQNFDHWELMDYLSESGFTSVVVPPKTLARTLPPFVGGPGCADDPGCLRWYVRPTSETVPRSYLLALAMVFQAHTDAAAEPVGMPLARLSVPHLKTETFYRRLLEGCMSDRPPAALHEAPPRGGLNELNDGAADSGQLEQDGPIETI